MFRRPIEHFHGSAVVVGCGQKGPCKERIHDDLESFYTIDIKDEHHPDFIFHIAGSLPASMIQRFQLTFLEHLPFSAYNSDSSDMLPTGERGFENILAMTHDHGFIFILGSPLQPNYRKSLHDRGLKYLELSEHAILIPKNQHWTLEDIQREIQKSHPVIVQTLQKCLGKTLEVILANLSFCTYTFRIPKPPEPSLSPKEQPAHQLRIITRDEALTFFSRRYRTKEESPLVTPTVDKKTQANPPVMF